MQLKPFSYQVKLKDHLKQQKKTWDWFSSVKVKEEQFQEFKTNLLKNTYRLDKESSPEIYRLVDIAKEKLLLDVGVTVYQAHNTVDNNASVAYFSGEVHIILSGPIVKLLNENELLSVLAHELSHVKLFTLDNFEFEVANRIIFSIANDYRTEDVYIETARLFRLYVELFCDRGSLIVTQDLNAVLSSLIKINTGLDKVSVESYLKQAEEIFTSTSAKAEHTTHPENYIRVRALNLWNDKKDAADHEISKMIEGIGEMDSLDLFKQEKVSELTFCVMQLFLKPKWIRTTEVLSLAKQFKSNYKSDDEIVITDKLFNEINTLPASVKDYLSYVLLDFSLVDPTLEDVPMGFAFELSENLGMKDSFNNVVKKEMKLGERKLMELQKKSAKALFEIKESGAEHIYDDK